jgi:hypothetical protein
MQHSIAKGEAVTCRLLTHRGEIKSKNLAPILALLRRGSAAGSQTVSLPNAASCAQKQLLPEGHRVLAAEHLQNLSYTHRNEAVTLCRQAFQGLYLLPLAIEPRRD